MLTRKDTTQKHGPTNTYWRKNSTRSKQSMIDKTVQSFGYDTPRLRRRLEAVSKQRHHQLRQRSAEVKPLVDQLIALDGGVDTLELRETLMGQSRAQLEFKLEFPQDDSAAGLESIGTTLRRKLSDCNFELLRGRFRLSSLERFMDGEGLSLKNSEALAVLFGLQLTEQTEKHNHGEI